MLRGSTGFPGAGVYASVRATNTRVGAGVSAARGTVGRPHVCDCASDASASASAPRKGHIRGKWGRTGLRNQALHGNPVRPRFSGPSTWGRSRIVVPPRPTSPPAPRPAAVAARGGAPGSGPTPRVEPRSEPPPAPES